MFDQAKDLISEVLAPQSYDQFFDDIVGKRPLALVNTNSVDRAKMLGPDPKQTILDAYERLAPILTCHSHAPVLPQPKPRAVADAKGFEALVKEYHDKDYTVRIPEVTSLSPALAQFNRALETVLGTPVDVVIFWSRQGLKAPVHHDRHDIICIQLTGKKQWFISSNPPTLPNAWNTIGEGPPPLEKFNTVDVGPGDLLYLPAGTAHTVQSPSESIHLSIGFKPLTLRDAVLAALDHFADLQKPLRVGATPRADDLVQGKHTDIVTANVQDALARLTQACQSDGFVQNALDLRQSRMVVNLPKLPASPAGEITPQTRIRRNPLALSHITATPQNLDFAQPGSHILVHLGAEESLRYMSETETFTVADIPGPINDDVRIALTKRLLACGFLEIEDPQ